MTPEDLQRALEFGALWHRLRRTEQYSSARVVRWLSVILSEEGPLERQEALDAPE